MVGHSSLEPKIYCLVGFIPSCHDKKVRADIGISGWNKGMFFFRGRVFLNDSFFIFIFFQCRTKCMRRQYLLCMNVFMNDASECMVLRFFIFFIFLFISVVILKENVKTPRRWRSWRKRWLVTAKNWSFSNGWQYLRFDWV